MNTLVSDCKQSGWSIVRKTMLVLGTSLALAPVLCLPVFAQLNLGRILGAITDQSGGAVVGATVTVIDVARGVSRPLISDGAGEYSAPSLTPGMYTVRAEAKGFKIVERTDIVVGVGQDVRVDLTLQPGEQTQTITVTGELPLVNTSNAQLGGTLESQQITDLPINGHQYTDMLNYYPGVEMKPGQAIQAFLSNGARPEADVWLFDGLYDVNPFHGAGPTVAGYAGVEQGTILPPDAIQEVNVIENPQAEYGWKPGAVVNTGLKSGTNSIHGTAQAFGRDTDLDARNAFLGPTQSKATDQLEQFGATVGGPIKKDKLFYFLGFEGQLALVGNPRLVQIPTTAAGAGTSSSFPDAIAAMNAAHEPLSQLSLNLAGCSAAGVCNVANGVFGNSSSSATVPLALNTQGSTNSGLVKIDYHLNDHNALNAEYFDGASSFFLGTGGIQPYWRSDYYYNWTRVARGVWVWTPNSTWVNEARFGYDGNTNPIEFAETQSGVPGPNLANLGFVSGAPLGVFPSLTISGFTAAGVGTSQINLFGAYSGLDTVSYTHGKHLFKFGIELRSTLFTGATFTNGNGTISFGTGGILPFSGASALEAFLSGEPSAGSLLLGNATVNVVDSAYAGFVQDDWRITPKITINLGLRYEYEPAVTNPNNTFGNFDPNTPSGLIQETSGKNVYTNYPYDFAPRLGVAYDVTGKGTTVVRLGAGIVYTTTSLLNIVSIPQGAQLNAIPTGFKLVEPNGSTIASPGNIAVGTAVLGTAQLPWALNTPIFNSSAAALACGNGLPATAPGTGNNPVPCSIAAINPNFREGYVTTWTLGIQHAFTNDLSLNIAYVGNHGTRLGGVIDANQPALGAKNSSGTVGAQTEEGRRPYYSQFPYIGQIRYYSDMQESNYDGLQASLSARAYRGLSFTAGYTLAHALDDDSSDTANPIVMNALNPNGDYGSSLYGATNHLTLAASYIVPSKKSPGQVLEGWKVNSAINLMSSFPFNAIDGVDDFSGTGELQDRWTLVGPASSFQAGGAGQVPCFGLATSTFGKTANCVAALPAACVAAAAAEPTGPGGTTGTASLNSLGCYMEGNSVIVPPAQGTFGSMGRDVLRGKAFHQWDLSATKDWRIKERLGVQFKIEIFNVFNRTQYASAPASALNTPSTFGQAQATPNSSNATALGSGGPRQIQLGMKLSF